jgi:hypothetical protein
VPRNRRSTGRRRSQPVDGSHRRRTFPDAGERRDHPAHRPRDFRGPRGLRESGRPCDQSHVNAGQPEDAEHQRDADLLLDEFLGPGVTSRNRGSRGPRRVGPQGRSAAPAASRLRLVPPRRELPPVTDGSAESAEIDPASQAQIDSTRQAQIESAREALDNSALEAQIVPFRALPSAADRRRRAGRDRIVQIGGRTGPGRLRRAGRRPITGAADARAADDDWGGEAG